MGIQKHAFLFIAFLAVSSLDIIVAFTESTLVTNKISVLVKTVVFVMPNFDNLCKNQVVSVIFEFLAGKHKLVVLFKTKR